MRFHLPKLYPITDRVLSGLSHCEQVKRLAAGGATLIQLREKHLSPRGFFNEAQAAVEFANQNSISLIINDRVDIALAVGAAGVHLGQHDMPPNLARKVLGKDAIIGYSTHSIEQAKLAANLEIDYLAFGPIFETQTKEDHDPVVGIEGLAHLREVVGDLPLVAIGGIAAGDVTAIFASGADSVAMISEIVGDGEAIERITRGLFDVHVG